MATKSMQGMFRFAVFSSILLMLASLARGEANVRNISGMGSVIDPDGDCTIGADNGNVTITVPAKPHDFAAELNRWNAPRVMSDVRGDFVVEVEVSGKFAPEGPSTIDGRFPYNGGGILVVVDDHNHLSLQRGTFWNGTRFQHYLNFELRKNSEWKVSKFNLEIDNTNTFLRLARVGNQMYGLTSSDGVHWRSYEPIAVDFPATVKLGVEVINSSSSVFSCVFENYKMKQKSPEPTGNLQMSLVDAKGNVVKKFSQKFAANASGNNVMAFTLPSTLAPGPYSVSGEMAVTGTAGKFVSGVYTVPSTPVTLTATSSNGFALELRGPVGSNFVIEASSDLSNSTNWQPVLYFTLTNSPAYLSDPTTKDYQQRFYRAVMK